MAKKKRRITIIKSQLQFGMVVSFIILGGALITANYAVTRLLFELGLKGPMTQKAVTITHLKVYFISIILVAVFSYIFGLWSSHKVAGPLYRFEKSLGKIKEGDLSERLYLRKGDFLHDTGESMNDALDSLRERASTIRDNAEIIDTILAELSGQSDSDGDNIKKAREMLDEIAGQFDLGENDTAQTRSASETSQA